MRINSEKNVSASDTSSSSDHGATKDYLERISKYVPAEVIAVYISANGAANSSSKPDLMFSLIFGVCLICTPIYITRFANTSREAWTNGGVSSIAFVVWAYASGGGFFYHFNLYDAPSASVILFLFTLISGLIQPKTKE